MTQEQKRAVKVLIDEGRTSEEIAKILGVSHSEACIEIGKAYGKETNRLSFEDFKKERKRREFANKAIDIWNKNKEAIVGITVVVGGVAAKVIKGIIKHSNLKKEAENKELYCYDRSLGHYWKLRRKLSNDEWVKIDQRKKNGERLADILEDLKVLA